jgi:hypothetical protein
MRAKLGDRVRGGRPVRRRLDVCFDGSHGISNCHKAGIQPNFYRLPGAALIYLVLAVALD